MIICPSCQSPLNDDAKNCPYCGGVIATDTKETTDESSQVEEVKQEEVKVEESPVIEEVKTEEVVEEVKQEEPVPMITCPVCSIEVVNTAEYCPNCGYNFNGELEETKEDKKDKKGKKDKKNKKGNEEEVKENEVTVKAKYGFFAYFILALYIITNIAFALFLFTPLAWTVPLTFIFAYRVIKGEKIGFGTKFFMFLFVNPVVGLLSIFMGKAKVRA